MIEIAGGILLAVLILGVLGAWAESYGGRDISPEEKRRLQEIREHDEANERANAEARFEQRREQDARHQRWLDGLKS